jgi:septum formation protein
MAPTLWLASNSPRRRQLLALTGWEFTVRPVDIDENPLPGEAPADYVLRLAETKARAAGRFALAGDLVLAADTTVADGNRILGKPESSEDACAMLRDLRGRDHRVYTAIGISDPRAGRLITDLSISCVWMRDYSDEEIDAYIASGDPFDKAGAYAIQSRSFHPVDHIEGCYPCVVGLPVCQVVRVMAQFGFTPPNPVTATCSHHLATNTPCMVYQNIIEDGNH